MTSLLPPLSLCLFDYLIYDCPEYHSRHLPWERSNEGPQREISRRDHRQADHHREYDLGEVGGEADQAD